MPSGWQLDVNAWMEDLVDETFDRFARGVGYIACLASCVLTGFAPGPCGALRDQIAAHLLSIVASCTGSYAAQPLIERLSLVDYIRRLAGEAVNVLRVIGRLMPWLVFASSVAPCLRACSRGWIEPPGLLLMLHLPSPPLPYWDPQG